MKRLLIALILISLPALAQESIVTVSPYLSTKAIASCVTRLGNDTITATAKPFGSVVVGQPVYGPGVPANTVVTYLVNAALDSEIVISNAITSGGTKTLEFGYYVHTTYASGDWLGLPFQIYDTGVGGTVTLVSVSISDNADLLAATDIVLFSAYSDTLGLDSVAVAVPLSEAPKVLAELAITSINDLGGVRVLNLNNIQMAVPKNKLWGRLLAKASIAPLLVVQPYTVRLGFK